MHLTRLQSRRLVGREVPVIVRRKMCVSVLAGTVLVLAAGDPAAAAPADPAIDQVREIIGNIQVWIMGLAAVVATLFLTLSGVYRMSANGSQQQLDKAAAAFRNALYGYAVMVLAPLALAIVQSWIGG